MKRATRGLALLALMLGVWTGSVQAEIVRKPVSDNVTATAEYRAGDPAKPAILMLHGFLQTRDFATVRRLSNAIYDWNYTVLAPTLSLGVDERARSLPCEAVQTHTMDDAVFEVALWVDWLVSQGHDRIILVGHSSGSATHVAYLSGEPSPAVREAILISLVAFGPGKLSFETEVHATAAREAVATGGKALGEYGMAFCRHYPAPPQSFLSYYDWSRERTAAALDRIQVPYHVIVGSADQRMNPQWLKMMEASQADVIVVEGANHFFDDAHEFDLLDIFERLLEG